MKFHYGPAFQAIEQLWIAPGEALAHIRVPESIEAELLDYQMHPAILDACFQVLLAVAANDPGDGHDRNGVYLPIGIDRVQVHAQPKLGMWSHASLVKQSAELLEGNIVLFDEDGTVLAEIQGFRVQSLEHMPHTSSQRMDKWLYEMQWLPMPRKEEEEHVAADGAGSWLIFADGCDFGTMLASLLEEQNQTCILVSPGETYAKSGPRRYTIRATHPEDYRRLLEEALDADLSRCRGMVHLWSLDSSPVTKITSSFLQNVQDRGPYSILYLVQALGQTEHLPRLWLITRGGQPVGSETLPLSIAQAPLWGLGRVLYEEDLTLRGALVDLDPIELPGDVATLFNEIWNSDGENQVAFRAGQRYVARLEHMSIPQTAMPTRFRPDSSYLITGGLGALGLLVSRWMIQRGARHLILMGRTQLPPRSHWHTIPEGSPEAAQIANIRELEALGASIHPAAVDITDEIALTSFLDAYESGDWPPIRGAIHAAGIVRDQILMHMDKDALTSVLRPKMLGAWALHHCLRGISLDFFVLFSSVAAVVTAPGQANYAAANAFLDALAYYRRAQGLPAMTINWGPWATGMVAKLNLIEHYAQRGMDVIPPEFGMHIFDQLLGYNRVQAIVASVNWPLLFESHTIIPPLIHHLGDAEEEAGDTSSDGHKNILQQLQDAGQAEGLGLVQSYLKGKVAQVLRCDQSRLDMDRPLNTLGMDSMMAVDLKNRVEKDTNVSLSIVALLQGTSAAQLALQITARLQGEGEAGNSEALEDLSEQVDEATLTQLLEELERLSLDDVTTQLASGR